MARKEIPRIDPALLYEERIVYVIELLLGSAFGRIFYAGKGNVGVAVNNAAFYPSEEDAREAVINNQLENVSILKVWV